MLKNEFICKKLAQCVIKADFNQLILSCVVSSELVYKLSLPNNFLNICNKEFYEEYSNFFNSNFNLVDLYKILTRIYLTSKKLNNKDIDSIINKFSDRLSKYLNGDFGAVGVEELFDFSQYCSDECCKFIDDTTEVTFLHFLIPDNSHLAFSSILLNHENVDYRIDSIDAGIAKLNKNKKLIKTVLELDELIAQKNVPCNSTLRIPLTLQFFRKCIEKQLIKTKNMLNSLNTFEFSVNVDFYLTYKNPPALLYPTYFLISNGIKQNSSTLMERRFLVTNYLSTAIWLPQVDIKYDQIKIFLCFNNTRPLYAAAYDSVPHDLHSPVLAFVKYSSACDVIKCYELINEKLSALVVYGGDVSQQAIQLDKNTVFTFVLPSYYTNLLLTKTEMLQTSLKFFEGCLFDFTDDKFDQDNDDTDNNKIRNSETEKSSDACNTTTLESDFNSEQLDRIPQAIDAESPNHDVDVQETHNVPFDSLTSNNDYSLNNFEVTSDNCYTDSEIESDYRTKSFSDSLSFVNNTETLSYENQQFSSCLSANLFQDEQILLNAKQKSSIFLMDLPITQSRRGNYLDFGSLNCNPTLDDKLLKDIDIINTEVSIIAKTVLCSLDIFLNACGSNVTQLTKHNDNHDNQTTVPYTVPSLKEIWNNCLFSDIILPFYLRNVFMIEQSYLEYIKLSIVFYFRLLLFRSEAGVVSTSVIVYQLNDALSNLIERGYERQPLTCPRNIDAQARWLKCDFYSEVPMIKMQLLLLFLEALIVSLLPSRHIISEKWFISVIRKFNSEYFDLMSDNEEPSLFDYIISELTSQLDSYVNGSVDNYADAVDLIRDTNGEACNINEASSVSEKIDIEEIRSSINNFYLAYVSNIGCAVTTYAFSCSIQRKSGLVDEIVANVDQRPLSPPALFDTLGYKHFRSCYLAVIPYIDSLAKSIQDNRSTYISIAELDNNQNSISVQLFARALSQSKSAKDVLSLLEFDTDGFEWDPIECIIKDNKHFFTFGTLSKTINPICGGCGTLYNNIIRSLSTNWSTLNANIRTALASDSSLIEHQYAVSNVPRIPARSLAGAAQWFPSCILQTLLQNIPLSCLLSNTIDLIPSKVIKTIGHDCTMSSLWNYFVNSNELNTNMSSIIQIPTSATHGFLFPVVYFIKYYESNSILAFPIKITNSSVPFYETIKDPAIPIVLNDSNKVFKQSVLGVQSLLGKALHNKDSVRFNLLAFSNNDQKFFKNIYNEDTRTAFTNQTKQVETSEVKHSKNLTILWTSPTEDSLNFGRLRRFQSMFMWVRQLCYEENVQAQIEAVIAIAKFSHLDDLLLMILFQTALKTKYHTYVRVLSIEAISLSCKNRPQRLKIVLNLLLHIYYFYAAPIYYTELIGKSEMQDFTDIELDKFIQEYPVVDKFDETLTELGMFFSFVHLEIVLSVIKSLSKLRNIINNTPDVVMRLYLFFFTKLPASLNTEFKKMQLVTAINFDSFLSELVATFKNTSWFSLELKPTSILYEQLLSSYGNSKDDLEISMYDHLFRYLNNCIDSRVTQLWKALMHRVQIEKNLLHNKPVITLSLLELIKFSQVAQKLFQLCNLVNDLHPDILFGFTHSMRGADYDVKHSTLHLSDKYSRLTQLVFMSYTDTVLDQQNAELGLINESILYYHKVVHKCAIKTLLSLIMQGKILPPNFLRSISINALISKIKKHDYNDIFSDQQNLDFFYGCVWVDSLQLQSFLCTSGTGVYYACKFAVAASLLFPFNDLTHNLQVTWATLLEVLDEIISLCPHALVVFFNDATPCHCIQDLSMFNDSSRYTNKKLRIEKLVSSLKHDYKELVSVNILTYELLFSYLMTVFKLAESRKLFIYVREVIIFLFGFGVPQCVIISRDFFKPSKDSNMNSVVSSIANDESMINYIVNKYSTLSTPMSLELHKLYALKKEILYTAGVVASPSVYLHRLTEHPWIYSKSLVTWPLPIAMNWTFVAQIITEALMENRVASWFINQVNPADNPSYYKVIKNPIWFNRIIEKFEHNSYKQFDQWKLDLYTILRNCRTYNQKGSKIVQDCEMLQALIYQLLHFSKRLLNSVPEFQASSDL